MIDDGFGMSFEKEIKVKADKMKSRFTGDELSKFIDRSVEKVIELRNFIRVSRETFVIIKIEYHDIHPVDYLVLFKLESIFSELASEIDRNIEIEIDNTSYKKGVVKFAMDIVEKTKPETITEDHKKGWFLKLLNGERR